MMNERREVMLLIDCAEWTSSATKTGQRRFYAVERPTRATKQFTVARETTVQGVQQCSGLHSNGRAHATCHAIHVTALAPAVSCSFVVLTSLKRCDTVIVALS